MVKNVKRPRQKQKEAGKRPSPKTQKPIGRRPTLFGFHAVIEAWLNPERKVHALYLTKSSMDKFLQELKSRNVPRHYFHPPERMERSHAGKVGDELPAPIILSAQEIDRLCPDGAVHQGIALVCDSVPEISLNEMIIKHAKASKVVFLMLDQVTDPHNVGAILRSASAFGANGVIMQRRHAPELDGVLAKTACGAVDHIDVAYETNLSRALEELKHAGYFTYGLDERGEQPVNSIKPEGKNVLVLGAEGSGLRRLIRENCDVMLRLPTGGAIASLNVSNAAAVALFAFTNNK